MGKFKRTAHQPAALGTAFSQWKWECAPDVAVVGARGWWKTHLDTVRGTQVARICPLGAAWCVTKSALWKTPPQNAKAPARFRSMWQVFGLRETSRCLGPINWTVTTRVITVIFVRGPLSCV